jgi:rod shape-determining protein MreC
VSLRDRPFLELKVPLTWTAAVALIVAGVIGLALLLGDRRQTLQSQTYVATRNVVDTVEAPVSNVLAAPVRWAGGGLDALRNFVLASAENDQLRAQVAELQQWRDQAIALQNTDARLRGLLGLKIDPPIPMVSALVITDVRGPFSNTRLANAGREHGVVEGNPVISEHGMVGRVLGVGHGVSRILLLTDISSRTPVLVDRTNARAILTGDGGPNPKLAYLRGAEPVMAGDRILTSGDGGMFPRGLPIGVAVKGLDGAWRVRLYADDAPIDYVRILLFKDFSQLADLKELSNVVVPPLPAAQAAQIAALAKPSPAKPQAASTSPVTPPSSGPSTPAAVSEGAAP